MKCSFFCDWQLSLSRAGVWTETKTYGMNYITTARWQRSYLGPFLLLDNEQAHEQDLWYHKWSGCQSWSNLQHTQMRFKHPAASLKMDNLCPLGKTAEWVEFLRRNRCLFENLNRVILLVFHNPHIWVVVVFNWIRYCPDQSVQTTGVHWSCCTNDDITGAVYVNNSVCLSPGTLHHTAGGVESGVRWGGECVCVCVGWGGGLLHLW